MVGEGLGRSLHEEGQERQLGAVLGKESVLRTRAQSSNLRDVDLDNRGQLSRGLQRLDHTASDRLTQSRHLFGRATQRRRLTNSGGRRGGSSRGGRCGGSSNGSAGGSGGSLNVLAANAAADTRARHGRQIDAELAGELTNDRGDIRGAGHGNRGFNDRSSGSRLCQRRCVREGINRSGRCGGSCRRNRSGRSGRGSCLGDGSSRGSRRRNDRDDGADLNGLVLGNADLCQEAGDGGGNLGVDLVRGDLEQRLVGVNGVAHGLQPRGDGALGDGLAQSGHAHLGTLRGSGGRGGSGLDRSCSRRRRSLDGSSCGCSSWGCRSLRRIANASDLGTDLDGLILGDQDFQQDAGHGGGDLGVDLVRGHLNDGLVEFDGVADLLEPRGDGALGDGLAQSGHGH